MRRLPIVAALFAFLAVGNIPAGAPAQGTGYDVALRVDASKAVQGLVEIHETMTVPAGPLTLMYPKWIPGEHAPNGPIQNVTDLVVTAGGTKLEWARDPVDLYAYHVNVPAAGAVTVDFTFLGNTIPGVSTARLATPNMLSLEWNKVVLTPKADDQSTIRMTPEIVLPGTDWKFATALETANQNGADVTFKPTTLDQLVDSPLDAGINSRVFPLYTWDGAPVVLAAFADTPQELAASDKTVEKLKNLVAQMHALYKYRHWNHYTFLLTLTDEMPGEGLEHHQSSDNGTGGDFFTSEAALASNGSLLPHEYNHSWDGKFRRPDLLATPNLNVPMIDDGLWVYEGMTQFYGELQAERASLWTEQQWLDAQASTWARLDVERGRLTAPLLDTARASSIRRGYAAWSSERRTQDYYAEGAMMWLEADAIIHNMSGGKKSIDDFSRAFFGQGADTGAKVVPWNREQLYAALNAVQPYDWKTFIETRIDKIAPHPPNPFAPGGYKLVYRDKPSAFSKLQAGQRKSVDAWWSLGLQMRPDGTINDVLVDSPAGKAGIGPGFKILAINDRAFKGQEQVDTILTNAKDGSPIRMILEQDDVFRSVALTYTGGPRFPHLERVEGTPDVLGAIAKPLPVAEK
jgi:predicted metalloprotease with PDZ domain